MSDSRSWQPMDGRPEPASPAPGPGPDALPHGDVPGGQFAGGQFPGQWPEGPSPALPAEVPPANNDLLAPVLPRRSLKMRSLLAVVCAAALVGGGTAVSFALTGGASGASSPGAAVQALYTAMENSDVLGMLDALAPGERGAIEPGLKDIASQLERLNILSPNTDLNHVSGVSLHYGAVDTTTEQLSANVAAVTVAGTTVSGSVDPSQLPLGSFVTGLESRLGSGPTGATSGTSQSGPTVLGTVQVNGGWYVSLGYSLAINILNGSGASTVPPTSAAVQAQGASSPEQAVQDLFSALSNFDLNGLLADLPPDEMAALDAYAPDWLPKAQAALGQLSGKVKVTFNNLDLTTQAIDSGTLVKVGSGLSFEASGAGFDFSYANGCARVTMTGTTRTACQGGASNSELKGLLADLPPDVAAIVQRIEGSAPAVGFVTVEENGQWFVSPTRTLLQAVVAFLSEFEPQDLTTIEDNAQAIGQGLAKWEQQQLGGELPQLGAPSAGSAGLGGALGAFGL